jgi:hypothetical protein
MMWSVDAFRICKFYWNALRYGEYFDKAEVAIVIVIDLNTVFGSSYICSHFYLISVGKNVQNLVPYEQRHFGSVLCDSYVSEKNVTFHIECGPHEGKEHVLNCSDFFCTYMVQHDPINHRLSYPIGGFEPTTLVFWQYSPWSAQPLWSPLYWAKYGGLIAKLG